VQLLEKAAPKAAFTKSRAKTQGGIYPTSISKLYLVLYFFVFLVKIFAIYFS